MKWPEVGYAPQHVNGHQAECHGDPTLLIRLRLARFSQFASRCNRAAKARWDLLGTKIAIKEAICDDPSPNAFGFRVSELAWDRRDLEFVDGDNGVTIGYKDGSVHLKGVRKSQIDPDDLDGVSCRNYSVFYGDSENETLDGSSGNDMMIGGREFDMAMPGSVG